MKTVITYGTFDLLHTGHVNLLKRARALGDRLIVGVTTDSYLSLIHISAMKTRNTCSFRLRSVLSARKAAVYSRRPSAVPMPRPSHVPNMKSAAKPLAIRTSSGMCPCIQQEGESRDCGSLRTEVGQEGGRAGRSGKEEEGSVIGERSDSCGTAARTRGVRRCPLMLAVIAGVSSRDVRKRAGLNGEGGSAAWKRIVFSAGGRIAWHE